MIQAPGLRSGLRRLSTGLIAYGVVGLVVATIGFGALVWVNGRVTTLRDEVHATLIQQATALALASTVLHDASTAAESFSLTVDQASLAVSSAADTIIEVRSDMTSLEAQLRSINILGATPLSSSADAVGRIATSMVGLDARLALIVDSLQGNRRALAVDAMSLGRLSEATDALAEQMRSGVIDDSLGDLQRVISVTLLVLSIWMVVPAVGALVLGVWLRRVLARQQSARPRSADG